MRNLIEMLKRHEGLRLKPYLCTADQLTIGYGRNIESMGISHKEAEVMLVSDIERCYDELEVFEWFVTLDTVRQEAMVDLLFNLGLPRFLGFKKMIKHLSNKEYSQAAAELLNSRYAIQVGDRANELAYMLERGEYLV
jgi:lysozyme